MGKIYSALKKAQREAMLSKNESVTREATSQIETHNARLSPIPSGETGQMDDDLIPKHETTEQIPQQERGDRFSFDKIKEELFVFHQPHSVLSEQFRILCSRLKLNRGKSIRSIMVTSSVPDEGKTIVASNLAISIAQGFDQHVILIDADLRKPSLNEIFALKPNDGRVDFLKNEQNLSVALQKTDIHNLSILHFGKTTEHPSKLMASEKMHHLMEEIKSRYENPFIIFDSTPVQQTSEPLSLAEQVDCILVVVHAGKTNREMVKKTVDALGREKVLGIIFNHSNEIMKSHYHYYYNPDKKKE
jgi:protein-tyrosine kinase